MEIPFVKYQGTGNDFILIDARNHTPKLDVAHWCDRRFGIGADGLMYLQNSSEADFEMIYYNSDGNLSSMCGNGGRCLAHWAMELGIGDGNSVHFKAPDGFHTAQKTSNGIELSMNPVPQINTINSTDVSLDTGSPHFVRKCLDIPGNFVEQARDIRQSATYKTAGINVNFYQEINKNHLKCRTFERGVEDETLSCGTGVTAVALAYAREQGLSNGKIEIETQGGILHISFQSAEDGSYTQISLEGPAQFVFKGFID